MIQVACQTIVFGNTVIKDTIDSIFQVIAQAGYEGVEIGARHLSFDKPEYYQEILNKNHLQMVALHVGGNFLDSESIAEQLAKFASTIQFARKLGCKFIFLSGYYKQKKTVDDYIQESKIYNDMGKRCRDEDIKLCYHNHDWEIVNQKAGMKILLEETSPENLFLVPDVGWLTVANEDPVEFISENLNRVEVLHFKEFKPIREYSELGTGMVDFKRIYNYFSGVRKNFWVVAEQDETIIGPQRSAEINLKYIKGLIAK